MTFTNYENSTTNNVDLAGGNGFLRSLTTHPQTVNVAADSLSADGSYGIDFRTIDVDYRSLLSGSCNHAINASAGIRNSSLDQNATLNYLINGLTTVQTDVALMARPTIWDRWRKTGWGIGLFVLRKECRQLSDR